MVHRIFKEEDGLDSFTYVFTGVDRGDTSLSGLIEVIEYAEVEWGISIRCSHNRPPGVAEDEDMPKRLDLCNWHSCMDADEAIVLARVLLDAARRLKQRQGEER